MAKVRQDVEPFRLPNFVRCGEFGSVGVGLLSDRQASAYWAQMRPVWMAHVQKRRASLATPEPRP